MTTKSGGFAVYQAEDAGMLELHEPGKWYFEPVDYSGGDVYSQPYATADDALRAAEAWELNQAQEDALAEEPWEQ